MAYSLYLGNRISQADTIMADNEDKKYDFLGERYLDLVCKNLPIVNRAVCQYGDTYLIDYLKTLNLVAEASHQQRKDLIDTVRGYVGSLLGESLGRRAASDLHNYPIVLTANHHGVEYFSQTFQARLLFSLNAITGSTSRSTVLIFSFGSVALNNPTFPRGLLLYGVQPDILNDIPLKLPVFPSRLKRIMVSTAPSFDQDMVGKARAEADRFVDDKKISLASSRILHNILREDYCAKSVLKLPTYSQQAVVLNNRLWKRLFSTFKTIPDLIFLEIEKIASNLLKADLSNSNSLAWHLMFEPAVREKLLANLDTARGCWDRERLAQRLALPGAVAAQKNPPNNCGTVFYWGIDPTGKRIPLSLESTPSGAKMLCGIDDSGNTWQLPYTPQAITEGLNENRLLPSLFTCFLVIAFARGITCVGGYFQGEYLESMKKAVLAALQGTTGYDDVAALVKLVPADRYLDSMLTVMAQVGEEYLVPAGPVEIIAGGGITTDDVEHMLSMTLREAHLADMLETALDAVPKALLQPDWKTHLARGNYKFLAGKIVVK